MDKPYSYHTFLFPFLWNRELKSLQTFEKALDLTGPIHWQRVKQDPNYTADAEYYAQTQYFKRDVASLLLYPENENVVRHYRLWADGFRFSRRGGEKATGHYRIYKRNYEGTESVCYHLDMHQVKLSVFHTGVALLSLELEYWGEQTVTREGKTEAVISRSTADVNAINEYGRRISLPYIADGYHALVADRIEIAFDSLQTVFAEDFAETQRALLDPETELGKKGLSTHYVMKPLRGLLSASHLFTTDYPAAMQDPRKVFLEHVGDDRMFVCCVVLDDALSQRISRRDDAGNYLAFTDPEVYKLAFVETDLTCQSDNMLKDILTRCIYDRWINYGTVDVVTHHSLVRLTGEGVPYVVNSFLTQYVQMAALAVVQRASIIALENACVAETARGHRAVMGLQKQYVLAEKNILLDECTVQEQGVEVFQMLRRELYIRQRRESLDKRLREMCDLATLEHNRIESGLSWALTIIGFVLTLKNVIQLILELFA